MIYEIAITPEALEELLTSNDSAKMVEQLLGFLYPRSKAKCNVLVADLDTDSWMRSVKPLWHKVHPTKRSDAKELIKKIFELVQNHPRQSSSPYGEEGWLLEAKSGINGKLIDRVFASSIQSKHGDAEPLSKIADGDWIDRQFDADSPVALTEDGQRRIFEKLMCYSDLVFC